MLNPVVKDAVWHVDYHAGPMETMGLRIRNLRVAKGLSQERLAELCGVTKSAVSQWEDGTTTDIKLIPFLRLLETLGTDPRYLVLGPQRSLPDLPGKARPR